MKIFYINIISTEVINNVINTKIYSVIKYYLMQSLIFFSLFHMVQKGKQRDTQIEEAPLGVYSKELRKRSKLTCVNPLMGF